MSCGKKYIRTDKVCDKRLYVEVYEKWSEIGISYLTDSLNFSIYVGQINFGLEYYEYECKNDILTIYKYSNDFENRYSLVETKKYDIVALKKQKLKEK